MFNPKSFLRTLMKDDEFYQISIFWGGLLTALLTWAVHDVPKMLPHGHVPSIPPPTRLNTLTSHIPSHTATTRLNPKHLQLPNLQGWGSPAGPKI